MASQAFLSSFLSAYHKKGGASREILDRAGAEKAATSMDDILAMFNKISLETGN